MRLFASTAIAALLSFTACKSDPAPAPAPTAEAEKKPEPAPVPAADAAPAPAPTDAAAAAPAADAVAPAPGDAAAPAPTAELSAEAIATLDKGVAGIEAMSKLMAAGKENCDKLGDDLKAFMATNGEALTNFRKAMEGLPPEQQMAAQTRYQSRMEASMQGFMEGAMACENNTKVREAMSALTGAPPDAPDMPKMEDAKADTPVIAKLAEIVKASGGDCAKLGKGLEPFIAADLPDLKTFVTKIQAEQNPTMNGDMMVLMQALPQLQQCESEKSVQAIKAVFVPEEKK